MGRLLLGEVGIFAVEGSSVLLVEVVISFAIEASRSASAGCEGSGAGCALPESAAVAVSFVAVADCDSVGFDVCSAVLVSGGGSEPVVAGTLESAIVMLLH